MLRKMKRSPQVKKPTPLSLQLFLFVCLFAFLLGLGFEVFCLLGFGVQGGHTAVSGFLIKAKELNSPKSDSPAIGMITVVTENPSSHSHAQASTAAI